MTRLGWILFVLVKLCYAATNSSNTNRIIAAQNFTSSHSVNFKVEIRNSSALDLFGNVASLKSSDITSWGGRLVDYPATIPLNYTHIPLISCDSGNTSDYLRNAIGEAKFTCIMLYSTESDACQPLPDNDYTIQKVAGLFTTVSRQSARELQHYLGQLDKPPIGQLIRLQASKTVTPSTGPDQSLTTVTASPSPSQTSSANNKGKHNPAMVALYSITAVVSTLFILVVVSGAIRAVRHPARYGLQNTGGSGGSPQGRARGIAKAMLDTLPIRTISIPDKSAQEMGDISLKKGQTQRPSIIVRQSQTSPSSEAGPDEDHPKGPDPGIVHQDQIDTDQSSCPICMEEFEQGQEARILPCHHHFHPLCVDPWLLNVSGICPLCRAELVDEGDTSEPEEQLRPLPVRGRFVHSWSRYLTLVRSRPRHSRPLQREEIRNFLQHPVMHLRDHRRSSHDETP